MAEQAVYRGSREDLVRVIRMIPALLAGMEPDPWGIARDIQLRVGVQLLSLIQQAFYEKARGQVGSDGIQWPQLSPYTIAHRRRGPADKKAVAALKRARNLSSPENQRKRKAHYDQRLQQLVIAGVAPQQARGIASRYADRVVHGDRQKLPTVFQLLSQRDVLILIDTAALVASFSPGHEMTPSGAHNQVFRINPGEIIVGTREKTWHHIVMNPNRRLPRRAFWPDDLPAAWWGILFRVAQQGLAEALDRIIRERQLRRGA